MKFKGNDITNSDWVGIIAVLLIVISGSLFSYYFIVYEINSCTSDPLDYFISKEVNENYTYAELKVYYDKDDLVPIKTVEKDLKPNFQELPNLSSPYG